MGNTNRSYSGTSFAQRFAQKIVNNGNKPLYKDGFTSWWSGQPNMTKTLLTEKAVEEYNKQFGKPNYTGRNFFENWGQMRDREKEALRYYYEHNVSPEAKAADEHRANTTRQQLASGTSIVGTALSLVPHPVTRVSGAGLKTISTIDDWKGAQ